MLVLAGRMLDGEDDDFLSFVIDGVIDQIGVTLRHELAYTLDLLLPPDMRNRTRLWSDSRMAARTRTRLAGFVHGYRRRCLQGPVPPAA
jgi:hypothetical protein